MYSTNDTDHGLGQLLAEKFTCRVVVDRDSASYTATRDSRHFHWDLGLTYRPKTTDTAVLYEIDHLDWHFHAVLTQTEWDAWYMSDSASELDQQLRFFGLPAVQERIVHDPAEMYGDMDDMRVETHFDIYIEL
jgi:hypothetical protein